MAIIIKSKQDENHYFKDRIANSEYCDDLKNIVNQTLLR